MRNLFIVVIAAGMLITGCAAPKPLTTTSGNPEVTIDGATRKQVADKIVDAVTSRGMNLKTVNEYKIVATKPADNDFLTMLLFGSRYDGVPEYRLHFTLIDRTGNVKVFARAEVVTNPGSAFERVTDVTEGAKHDAQSMLQRLQAGFGGPSSPEISAPPLASPSSFAPEPRTQTKVVETRDARTAERLAKDKQCNQVPTSRLSAKGPGFETYNVECSNGDTMTIRCEYGNCRALQ